MILAFLFPVYAMAGLEFYCADINRWQMSSSGDRGDKLEVIVYYAMGKDGYPVHEGTLTNIDLQQGSHIQQKNALLRKVENPIRVEFDRDKCERIGKHSVSCANGKLISPTAVEVKRAHFQLTLRETKREDQPKPMRDVQQDLTLNINNTNYSMRSYYYIDYGDKCVVRNSDK